MQNKRSNRTIIITIIVSILLSALNFYIVKSVYLIASVAAIISVIINTFLKNENLKEHYFIYGMNMCIALFVVFILSGSMGTNLFVSIQNICFPSKVADQIQVKVIDEDNIVISENDIETATVLNPSNLREELNNNPKNAFIPEISDELKNSFFLYNLSNVQNHQDEKNRITSVIAIVTEMYHEIYGRIERSDYNILNAPGDFSEFTRAANELEVTQMSEGRTIEGYSKVIELRVSAFKIGKTRELALIISKDYYNLGNFYLNLKEPQNAFDSYINSLKYYNYVLGLSRTDEKYKYSNSFVAYKIGQVYHSIGDINNLEKSFRIDAYNMAYAYYTLSNKINSTSNSFTNNYYRAMVLHKIGIMTKDNSYAYSEALKQYIHCYESNYDQENRENLSKYISNVCTSCIAIKKRGILSPELKDIIYYQDLIKLHNRISSK